MKFELKHIEQMIFIIRGQKVMLDSGLAKLYGVETKVLNQAVKRNLERFPIDFMFRPDSGELEDLRSQFVTANLSTHWNYKRRSTPMLFTENGVAMLSGLLNSKRAIQVNISIMRTFTKLRSFLALENLNNNKISELERGTNKLFRIIFERLDSIELAAPKLPAKRNKIGL